MMTSTGAPQYIKYLEKYKKGKPEVDLVLMAMLFKIDLTILYMTDEGLMKQKLIFPFNTKVKGTVYLGPDGLFDVVYGKAFIKEAGICQSIILDVDF